MNQLRLLVRLRHIMHRPPSASRVWLILGVVAVCLVLYGIEQMVGGGGTLPPQTPRIIN